MASQLKINTLGGLTISLDGQPVTGLDSRKAAAILAYLACTGRTYPREVLAELFWEGRTQAQSFANLRVALTSLRQTVGDYVTITRETVSLDENSTIWLDVAAFEEALSAGELEQAVDLYQGDFLAGFTVDSQAFEDWTILERERLCFAAMEALDALISRCLETGDSTAGIAYATQLIQMDPLREETHRQLIRLLAQAGQRRAALAQYEKLAGLLRDELGVQPMPDTVALYKQIQAGEIIQVASTSPLAQPSGPESTAPPRHNLPRQATSFVGREPELQAILAQLENPDCRLLTLVGPGGIGKTRLALAVAERLLGDFTNGTFLVELTALNDPESIVSAIASAVDFKFYQSEDSPEQQLLNYLREKSMLLVLDNFEHLLDGVAIVDAILSNAPGVTILATSREALDVGWEWLCQVGGMRYPQDGKGAAEDYSALRLFAERARRMQPGFTIRGQRACAIRVCQLVGGMPLGIELATAWLRALPCEELVAELENSLDILETERRDVPDRHRSIRAVFESSWRRLSDVEREALMKLSVFRGGFTSEAAEAVAGASLRIRMALLNKSLLRRDPETGRYDMHELLRQYLQEILNADPDEKQRTLEGYCTYYADCCLRYEGSEYRAMLRELDNLRKTWNIALEHGDLANLRKFRLLGRFFHDQGWVQRGYELYAQAAEALRQRQSDAEQAIVLGVVLMWQGWFALLMARRDIGTGLFLEGLDLLSPTGENWEHAVVRMVAAGSGMIADRNEGRCLLEQSLSFFEHTDDQFWVVSCLYWMAQHALRGNETEEAQRCLERSVTLAGEITYVYGELVGLWGLGNVALQEQQFKEARSYYLRVLEGAVAYAAPRSLTDCLNSLAYACLGLNDFIAAEQYVHQAIAIAEDVGEPVINLELQDTLADVHYARGDYRKAQRLFEHILDELSAYDRPDWTTRVRNRLAFCALEVGDLDIARMNWKQALSAIPIKSSDLMVVDALVGWAAILVADKAYERAVELLAFTTQYPIPFFDKHTRVEARLQAELEATLPPKVFASAWARGKELDLAEMVVALVGAKVP